MGNELINGKTPSGNIFKSKTATGVLTAAEVTDAFLNNVGQGAIMTLTLPPAAPGMNFILDVITLGYAIHLKPHASNKIIFWATAFDDGDKLSLATPAIYDSVSFWVIETSAGSYDWHAEHSLGTWTDGGA